MEVQKDPEGRWRTWYQVGQAMTTLSSSGWIIIDRCGAYFGTILNFLRDESCVLPETVKGVCELLAEAKYYCIAELAESCEKALPKKERDVDPICRVPLITSAKEEQVLIGASTKVCYITSHDLNKYCNSHLL